MRRRTTVCAILLLAPFLSSCEKGETPVQTHDYNSRASGTLTLDPVRAIVVANELGPVIIEGGSDSSTVRWFIDKNVVAESQAEADQLLRRLSITFRTIGDTAFISLNSVPEVNFTPSSLSLTLPYWIPCTLRKVSITAEVSYLRSTFTGENLGTTTIRGHEGNCILAGGKGEFSVEIALPDSGLCLISAGEGNMLLKIPSSTSSLISATTGSGTLTYSGLVIYDMIGTTPPTSFTGRLGSGRGHIQLATGKGNINIVGF